MKISDNSNFRSYEVAGQDSQVEVWEITQIYQDSNKYSHGYERFSNRLESVKSFYQLKGDRVLHCFVVDKNHPDGKEIHCVTEKSLVIILNQDKYRDWRRGKMREPLITVLFARKEQIMRYYEELNIKMTQKQLEWSNKWYDLGFCWNKEDKK